MLFSFLVFAGEVLMLKKSISVFLFLVIFFSFTPLWSNTQDSESFLSFIPQNEEVEGVKKEKKGDEEAEEEEDAKKESETKEEKDESGGIENSDASSNKTTPNETKEVAGKEEVSEEETLQEEGARIVEEKALEGDFLLLHTFKDVGDENDKTSMLLLMNILKELEDANILFMNKNGNMAVHSDDKVENKEESSVEVAEDTEEGDSRDNFIEEQSDEKFEVASYDGSSEDDVAFNEDDFIIRVDDDFGDQEGVSEHDMPYDVDDDNFLTFDQEQDMENAKKEELSGRGELSSVVDDDDKVNISRYTNILRGQNIDFSYPGEGWVYLGEETSQKGLDYTKRKMEGGKTFFTFRAEVEGNYVLNFSYFDVFSGDFIVDAVSVKVMPNDDGLQKDNVVLEFDTSKKEKMKIEKQKRETAEVPMDKDKVGIKIEDTTKPVSGVSKNEDAKQENEKTANETSRKNELDDKKEKNEEEDVIKRDSENIKSIKKQDEMISSKYKEPEVFANVTSIAPENVKSKYSDDDAKLMIDEAQDAISQGDAKVALERLNEFFEVASTNIDKAYLLRGKAYELNGEFKNIKLALKAYKFLTKTFPDSPHRSVAMERIRYIEHFFVNIR